MVGVNRTPQDFLAQHLDLVRNRIYNSFNLIYNDFFKIYSELYKKGCTMDEIEKLKMKAAHELQVRMDIAIVLLSDTSTQERIEDLLDDRFRYPGSAPLSKKEETEYLNTIMNSIIYTKIDEIMESKKEILEVLNDRKKNTFGIAKSSLMKIQSILINEKQETKKEPLKRGRGRALPLWLLSLKKGRYTVENITEISGTDKRNVQKIMKKYCKNVDYIDAGGHLKKCVYHWEGI